MRIVSRRELMAMEPGVLFAQVLKDGQYGELRIYGGSFGSNDFTERLIATPEFDDCGELWQREEDMRANGASYPVDTAYGRDGLFDDNIRYLVYDEADIVSIVRDLRPYRRDRSAE
jgi:hypothetical protein